MSLGCFTRCARERKAEGEKLSAALGWFNVAKKTFSLDFIINTEKRSFLSFFETKVFAVKHNQDFPPA